MLLYVTLFFLSLTIRYLIVVRTVTSHFFNPLVLKPCCFNEDLQTECYTTCSYDTLSVATYRNFPLISGLLIAPLFFFFSSNSFNSLSHTLFFQEFLARLDLKKIIRGDECEKWKKIIRRVSDKFMKRTPAWYKTRILTIWRKSYCTLSSLVSYPLDMCLSININIPLIFTICCDFFLFFIFTCVD